MNPKLAQDIIRKAPELTATRKSTDERRSRPQWEAARWTIVLDAKTAARRLILAG